MYQDGIPEREWEKYKKQFNNIPALMCVKSGIKKKDLIARMEKAIKENKPIPDDDPIYMEIRDDRIY